MSQRGRADEWLIGWSDFLQALGPVVIFFNIVDRSEAGRPFAFGTAVVTMALILTVVGMTRIWRRYPKIRFVGSDNGEGADPLVKGAKQRIRTTHATGIVPHSVYQEMLLEKLKDKVVVERYVQRDELHKPEQYGWLQSFSGRKHYKQFEVPGGCPLPLDIMTFDNDTVVLHLPREESGDDFYSAIIIKDREIKNLFDNVFHRLRQRSECQTSVGR